jgi:hypothetical protein
MVYRRSLAAGLAAALGFAVLLAEAGVRDLRAEAQSALPASLADAEFWRLLEDISEPGGSFVSDNLVSNETNLSSVAAELAGKVKPGGAYLGVGPEQNFTYIAAIRPRIAFISDIRRGNVQLHLMYKALFELSADRADFVSRLFTKPRPSGLTAQSTAAELMNAYWEAPSAGEDVFRANLDAIKDVLVKRHSLPLSADDFEGVTAVYTAFYNNGPRLTYASTLTRTAPRGVSYADLMVSVDRIIGAERSYLATEEAFAFVKTLQQRNLIIPVVGDFAGPKALRAIGQYLKRHGAIVSAYYLSNVEDYLIRGGVWPQFCQNAATLPIDDASLFIRPLPIRTSFMPVMELRPALDPQALKEAMLRGGNVTIIAAPSATPSPSTKGGTTQPLGAIAPEVSTCILK